MFYVEEGLVRLETNSAQVLADLGPGECFGEAACSAKQGACVRRSRHLAPRLFLLIKE